MIHSHAYDSLISLCKHYFHKIIIGKEENLDKPLLLLYVSNFDYISTITTTSKKMAIGKCKQEMETTKEVKEK